MYQDIDPQAPNYRKAEKPLYKSTPLDPNMQAKLNRRNEIELERRLRARANYQLRAV
jgi:hypothetical protein